MTTPRWAATIRARWTPRHTTAAFATAYIFMTVVGRATVLPGETDGLAWPAGGVGVLWALAAFALTLFLQRYIKGT